MRACCRARAGFSARVAHATGERHSQHLTAAFATHAARSKNDINIAIQQLESSNFYLIRSSVRVPLPVDVTHAHYTVRALVLSPHLGVLPDLAARTRACTRDFTHAGDRKLDALDTRRSIHGGGARQPAGSGALLPLQNSSR